MPSCKRPLTVKFLARVTRPGKYYDGPRSNGLRFCVRRDGYKYWESRVMHAGRRRTFYLGAHSALGLHDAREAARLKVREVRGRRAAAGPSPGSAPAAFPPGAASVTFAEAAKFVIAVRSGAWARPEHTAKRWMRIFEQHVSPVIGSRSVSDITADDVVRVLEALEHIPRQRQVVRSRLHAVFSWALARGYRRDNPADASMLSNITVLKHTTEHHRALPHAQVGAALEAVRACEAWEGSRLVFEFLVLTAVRSDEARGAVWSEIDFDSAMWTVPARRMKIGVEHQVPLSRRALAVLRCARGSRALHDPRRLGARPELVFPSSRGRLIAPGALSDLLRVLGIAAVPHGFRSSFRDWCGETGVDFAVSEKCLAHTVGSQVTKAYARSSLFNLRVKVMEDWAAYVYRNV